jgi:hypothetical protein
MPVMAAHIAYRKAVAVLAATHGYQAEAEVLNDDQGGKWPELGAWAEVLVGR